MEESGIRIYRKTGGRNRSPERTNWRAGKNLRFLKGSLSQSRETEEITALGNQRDKEVRGDNIGNSHCLLLVPNEINPKTITINNKMSYV